jgi:hypothetical protein
MHWSAAALAGATLILSFFPQNRSSLWYVLHTQFAVHHIGLMNGMDGETQHGVA